MIHSELRALYNYWNSLRAGCGVPRRLDIDPREMACDARNLFILEDHGRNEIRFRLAGSALLDVFEMDFRDLDVRAIMAQSARESFIALIAEVLEDPGIGYARLSDPGDPRVRWEINLLPLQSGPGRIDRVIGCLHPLSGGPQWGRRTPLRFQIDHMSVEPVERGAETGAGLEEKAEPFLHGQGVARGQGASISQRHLTAIEGDGAESESTAEEQARRRREHLRLVKK
ncbi:MAG TPA: PAS domain-containing protein [Paracoccaceae bacterium]|nr:PAS domain-containing protein [Paracoccaceae bacterium]